MKQLSLWTLLCFPFVASSQTTIRGILQSSNDEPISGASITITDTCTDNIIAYSFSDKNGKYEVVFRSGEKAVCISIQSMSYSKIVKSIENKSQTQNFKLQDEHIELREVVVKPPPITRRGDTINYHVNSFVKEQDRSIADVLKRMPGLDVLSDGKVIYQGKPINKYYIEGLDLLGGKYNLVNQNLPHADVLQVQIIENHQPLNILDSLVFSDKAALNISLKNKHTFTGQVELGAGFSPLLWDVNATPMLFTKQQQMLISYQSNNIGKNVASQFKTLSIEDLLEQFESGSEKRDLLSVQKLSQPNFPDKRWLDNNIHLLAANYLHNLKKDYELRLNVLYLNDSTDVVVNEQSDFTLNINRLKTAFTLTGNHPKYYLYNSLKGQVDWSHSWGTVSGNRQRLDNPYYSVSNGFSWFRNIANGRLKMQTNNKFNRLPQTLTMKPGLYPELFNDSLPYDRLQQTANLNEFISDEKFTYSRIKKRWSRSYTAGIRFSRQELDSELHNIERPVVDAFKNNVSYAQHRYYVGLKHEYSGKKLRMSMNLLFGFQRLKLSDKVNNVKNTRNKFYTNPSLSVRYVGLLWESVFSASYSENYSDIHSMYGGYILSNYRNIMKNDIDFAKTRGQHYALSVSYRDPIKLMNARAYITYSFIHSDRLYEQNFNGILSVRKALPYDNNTDSKTASAMISKGFNRIISKIGLTASYQIGNAKRLYGGDVVGYQRNTFVTNPYA